MKVCCIGGGYVGGPTMAVIAKHCPEIEVVVVDIDKERIRRWNSGNLPVYEPGLQEIVEEVRGRNLFFSEDMEGGIRDADIVFISVNTPTKGHGIGAGRASDLRYVENCARMIRDVARGKKIVVEKSTIPVRTGEVIRTILNEGRRDGVRFDVVSNPEFLAEGSAIRDLENPDRVLLGGEDSEEGREAVEKLVKIYERWVPRERIIRTNTWSAELSKLTANAFLAQRVSSINSISAVCEVTGANIMEVERAVGSDKRIGDKFLRASVGFGGSCFEKDILNLVYLSETFGLYEVARYWEQVVVMNNYQKERFVKRMLKEMFNTIAGKVIGVLGVAFKKDTNDTRYSPALTVIGRLLEEEAHLRVYDPRVEREVIERELEQFGLSKGEYEVCGRGEEVFEGADGVVVLTEWDEFKGYDYGELYERMRKPACVFDGRSILDLKEMRRIGYKCYGVGIGDGL